MRNLNKEIIDVENHRYAYDFDIDVMHGYMCKSFEPFLFGGEVLELGCYMGNFTERLKKYFDRVVAVEGSDQALKIARSKFKDDGAVEFICATFETVSLDRKFNTIVLTHVLEHLDDPVRLLSRINDEWLSDGGRLLLVCPNANAPSRQIAVHMGLISCNSAVTESEAQHGHRITYSLDTLERDVRASGLNVIHRSGIFFKALANFQWDKVIELDIVSKEYLDGCYKLGMKYPDLCSSIFLVCEKGVRT